MKTIRVSRLGRVFAISFLMLCGSNAYVGRAQLSIASLTSVQAGDGLKEALSRGVSTAVSSTGRPGGYFENSAIKILMPPSLQKVEKGLRAVGQGPRVDDFVKSMNSAAEAAAPAARAIFMEALRSMTIEDAKGIVTGGNTAGTEYFKRTTSSKVSDAFRPTIDTSMDKIGVTAQFKELMGNAPAIPFMKTPNLDINAYVLEKAVDGLFVVMGQEETKIRTNPAAQVTPLLKKVFGGRL
jgi:hypothetical protein